MKKLSEVYDVIENLRGKASKGYIRPTLNQLFNSTLDFENISSHYDPEFLAKITSPDGAADDNFGYSVAISDTKIVVGARLDDDRGDNSGSAYIFNTDGTYVTKITAPDGADSDYFGNSVAISDTKIVVGARGDDTPGGANAGSAYVFNTDGTYVTKITAPDGAADDYFGWSVAISDTKIVVGAYLDDDTPGGANAGSAYVFNTDGTYVTKITAPDGAASDYFGNSVAISDTKIVVGAQRGDTPGGADAGSAYIFNTDGTYVTKITAPDGAASDYFGNSVAISDTKIVVGAPYDDNAGGSNAGSAYIYDI